MAPFNEWLERVQPYKGDFCEAEADLVLSIERIPPWTVTSEGDDMAIEYQGGKLRSVRIRKMTVVGSLKKIGDTLVGEVGVTDDYPGTIDFLFRTCLSMLCEERGDLIVHSSALIKDGEAWLFVGDSGSGKTTIAMELNEGGIPASVDRTVVFKGEGGRYHAASTPFGDRNCELRTSASAPIGGIVFIEQGNGHRVSTLSQLESIRLLLRQTIAPARDRDVVARILDTSHELTRSVFTCSMVFSKDEGFWEHLRKEKAKWIVTTH